MHGDTIEAFWREYLDTLPPDSPVRSESYGAESFGNSPEMADEIGKEPTLEMPLVCEWFRTIYPPSANNS